MIDVSKAIQSKTNRGVGDEIDVNSAVISEARVWFDSGTVEILLISNKEHAQEYRNISFHCGLTEAFGTESAYKFCFRVLESSTEFDRPEITDLLRNEVKVGQSVKSNSLEIRFTFSENVIDERI